MKDALDSILDFVLLFSVGYGLASIFAIWFNPFVVFLLVVGVVLVMVLNS